jgi:hypothetical protein
MKNGVTHHLFVEQSDVEQFTQLVKENTLVHVKPDGGEGGLGKMGTMARFPCYKIMQKYLLEGDTYIQLDSDVILVDDEIIIEGLKCGEDEVKGFYYTRYPTHLLRDKSIPPTDVRFFAMSGMTICAGWKLFNKSIPDNEQDMVVIIDFLLKEGYTPSEDVVLSYLLQRSDFKLTNLVDTFWRVFHANGDIEILNWMDKSRFAEVFNGDFLKEKMLKGEMVDFVSFPLCVGKWS